MHRACCRLWKGTLFEVIYMLAGFPGPWTEMVCFLRIRYSHRLSDGHIGALESRRFITFIRTSSFYLCVSVRARFRCICMHVMCLGGCECVHRQHRQHHCTAESWRSHLHLPYHRHLCILQQKYTQHTHTHTIYVSPQY